MTSINDAISDVRIQEKKNKAGPAGYISLCFIAALNVSGVPLLSSAFLLLSVLVAVFVFASRLRVHFVAKPALLYILVVTLIGVAVRSVPGISQAPAWLNGDGRYLVALLPLVVICTCDVRWADLNLFVRGVQFAVWFNVPFLIYALVSGNVIRGLMSTHHAVGMSSAATLMILLAARKSSRMTVKPGLVVVGLSAVICAMSGSRTALLGLLAVLLWEAWNQRSVKNVVRGIVLTCVVIGVAAWLSDRVASSIALPFDPVFREGVTRMFTLGTHRSEVSAYYQTINAQGSAGGEVGNVYARFYYWGVAWAMWIKSPLFGIGSFRFNDGGLVYSGWEGVANFATLGQRDSTGVVGAHNQFIGTAVENGLVGLTLLFATWLWPYRLVGRRREVPEQIRKSAQRMVPFAFATALTGLTLTSPGLTFVCLTWLTMVATVETPKSDPG